jgi:DNA-binding CsgD family transcriptional regulator
MTSNASPSPRSRHRPGARPRSRALALECFEQTLDPLVRDLHEAAASLSLADFPRWALERLVLHFDCERAAWGTSTAPSLQRIKVLFRAGGGAVADTVSDGLGAALSRVIEQAQHAPAMGRAMLADSDAAPRRRLELACMSVDGVFLRLLQLERSTGQQEFAEAERVSLQLDAPHLWIAWQSCQRFTLLERASGATGRAAALIDADGAVHAAIGSFYSQLRAAWPDWSGTRLPAPLMDLVRGSGAGWIGPTRWTSQRCGPLLLVQGQTLGALSRLTAREASVVAALLAGESYDTAARGLGISVNTLRHAVSRAYRKLDVTTKFELHGRIAPTALEALRA